jgi:hypothetical protein
MQDTFTKWLLAITATMVIAIGTALMTTIVTLREDMAVIKQTVARIERSEVAARVLEDRVAGHEYRITTLERSTTGIDTVRWRRDNGR